MECPFELPIGEPFESRDYQYSMTDGKGVFRVIIKGSKTQANYARNAINSHEKLYREGYEDGLRAYAWWKDGIEYVGSCGTTLKQALKKAEQK